jgi:hypothetical protein
MTVGLLNTISVVFENRLCDSLSVVVSCASTMDEPSCVALVEGLSLRKKTVGGDVFYLHV